MDQATGQYSSSHHDCATDTGVVAIDSVFGTIDAHQQAAAIFHREHAAYAAAPGRDHVPVCNAMSAWCTAAKAMIGTLPSSLAGVQALQDHLMDETNCLARHCIVMPNELGGTWSTYDDVAVTWLCDRHAARLGG